MTSLFYDPSKVKPINARPARMCSTGWCRLVCDEYGWKVVIGEKLVCELKVQSLILNKVGMNMWIGNTLSRISLHCYLTSHYKQCFLFDKDERKVFISKIRRLRRWSVYLVSLFFLRVYQEVKESGFILITVVFLGHFWLAVHRLLNSENIWSHLYFVSPN